MAMTNDPVCKTGKETQMCIMNLGGRKHTREAGLRLCRRRGRATSILSRSGGDGFSPPSLGEAAIHLSKKGCQ